MGDSSETYIFNLVKKNCSWGVSSDNAISNTDVMERCIILTSDEVPGSISIKTLYYLILQSMLPVDDDGCVYVCGL